MSNDLELAGNHTISHGATHIVVGEHPSGARLRRLCILDGVVDSRPELVGFPLANEQVEGERLAQTLCGGVQAFVLRRNPSFGNGTGMSDKVHHRKTALGLHEPTHVNGGSYSLKTERQVL